MGGSILMAKSGSKIMAIDNSQPTPAALIELQKQIFENRIDLSRVHIRSSAAIKNQIEAAKDTVGALIPIIGGTCTISNQCPAKYACMGCAGHAPDPAKRPQVIELKAAYKKIILMADKHKLPAEKRKALDILTNCDDVLAEMDLIEASDNAASKQVMLEIEEKHNGKGKKQYKT